jgi:hypothetical protein
MDLQLRVHDTLRDVLRQAASTAWVEASLRALKDRLDHCLIRVTGHWPWVVVADNILRTVASLDNIVNEPNTLAESNEIEVVGEEIQVDVRLLQWVGGVVRAKGARRGKQGK